MPESASAIQHTPCPSLLCRNVTAVAVVLFLGGRVATVVRRPPSTDWSPGSLDGRLAHFDASITQARSKMCWFLAYGRDGSPASSCRHAPVLFFVCVCGMSPSTRLAIDVFEPVFSEKHPARQNRTRSSGWTHFRGAALPSIRSWTVTNRSPTGRWRPFTRQDCAPEPICHVLESSRVLEWRDPFPAGSRRLHCGILVLYVAHRYVYIGSWPHRFAVCLSTSGPPFVPGFVKC